MISQPQTKYQPFRGVSLPDRQWPNNHITHPPIWMSTDLRDGNQALIDPMSIETKLRFFKQLVAIGFKQIEVGFPSASDIDFNFVRLLIEQDHIPDDVTIEVLVQARYDLIERTVESLRGAKQAILHLYNPIAPAFRELVYKTDKAGVKGIATQGTTWVKALTEQAPEVNWTYQYSPEVFSSTEIEFAKEVCDAVVDIWQPSRDNKIIINLPATIEMNTPNTYADQIEWMHRHLNQREHIILSVHPHNDRGTAVAAAELAVMAGADRVEGCLFGNGERTGNVDLVTLALNLYTQGVHPNLDFSKIDQVRKLVEECNQLPVHPRHPYAGELVFTAFSGSHQDAIKKGLAVQKPNDIWQVPYLPIDPADLGRGYDAVVRVNSQSGKGGVSFLLDRQAGLQLPRKLQIEFSRIVQQNNDSSGKEMSAVDIVALFEATYLTQPDWIEYKQSQINTLADNRQKIDIQLIYNDSPISISGIGNGPIDAAANAIRSFTDEPLEIVDYHEHAIGEGSAVTAVCYLELKTDNNNTRFGVAKDSNIMTAAIKAMLGGINRKVAVAA
ncbi:2-isopropylmalate synthase [Paraglaciecola polaris]|uniref:2-isopropylmalate synthase n=1 Tax=Paraglaciecola polaris LMG 21857 TaxID=1129793 RepID=K7A0Q5_9ALTE|nr:2-isopropylmalate synthase [Paraglaciecola polaris]GAC34548.1 2-isopropylmalate synthase 2 [Paraglaciecola polaris LMG 21857]|tara:strand:+ start:22675 stop:24342 length:1668 start_codon:yes stop_codon:yes gene_type:complete